MLSQLLSEMQEATNAARGQGSAKGIGAVTMTVDNGTKSYQLRYFEDTIEMAQYFGTHGATVSLVYAITLAAAQEMANNYRPSYQTQAF